MNQSPISLDTLTPKPENVRPATRKVLIWILGIAFVLTAAKWYYDEIYLPKQPLAWQDYDPRAFEAALSEGRSILLLVESETTADNIAMRDAVENIRNRKYVRRNRMLSIRLKGGEASESFEQFSAEWPDVTPPALMVFVGGQDLNNEEQAELDERQAPKDKLYTWDGATVSADDVYEVLFEMRMGRKPSAKP